MGAFISACLLVSDTFEKSHSRQRFVFLKTPKEWCTDFRVALNKFLIEIEKTHYTLHI